MNITGRISEGWSIDWVSKTMTKTVSCTLEEAMFIVLMLDMELVPK